MFWRMWKCPSKISFICVSQAGGCAGMCVDLTLFPLDTIKTRLQSQQGFHKAGGFRGIYAGVPSAAVGSFPNGMLHYLILSCSKWHKMTDVHFMSSRSLWINRVCLVLAAAFFVTYESTKSVLSGCFSSGMAPVTHMIAASLGEIVRSLSSLLLFNFS